MSGARAGERKSLVAELAVRGGAPAFRAPLHVGGPNVPGRAEFEKLVGEILDSRQLTNDGPMVRRLEAAIAERVGVDHCVAVSNGTLGLELVLRALDLTGEVIVPSYTFVASAHAIRWVGLQPVFVEIDASTHLVDVDAVRAAITPQTSAILAVHLWGQGANADALEALASEFGLRLVFDAAHAFGSTSGGAPIGGRGDAEVFSFHSTKFFNTFEGGAVVTRDESLARRLRLQRNFGFDGIDSVVGAGTNAKLPEISAAMGIANLQHLDEILQVNAANRQAYSEGLRDLIGLRLLAYDEGERNNNQYVVLEVFDDSEVDRDELVRVLRAENIMARKYFWPSCHRMGPYRDEPPPGGFRLPATETVADRVIVLPTGMSVSPDDIKVITDIIRLVRMNSAEFDRS